MDRHQAPLQELDLKSTLQYEGQTFIDTPANDNQNLVGSTLDATWAAKLPLKVQFKQEVSWIPAYNNPYAYSAGETDSLTMPFFKSLSFTIGSNDSYLNDPPPLLLPPGAIPSNSPLASPIPSARNTKRRRGPGPLSGAPGPAARQGGVFPSSTLSATQQKAGPKGPALQTLIPKLFLTAPPGP